MFVITGITGKVGGIIADTLLKAGEPIRALVRGADREQPGRHGDAKLLSCPTRAMVTLWRRLSRVPAACS
jgi:nucleoside-diphosphate-sugar epimerase